MRASNHLCHLRKFVLLRANKILENKNKLHVELIFK
jgi:hypothetical protein